MMIIWRGKNCSDGCPFYTVTCLVSNGVQFTKPRCGVAGHEDVGTEKIFDIRLKLEGDGADAYCPKPAECPFADVHGLPLEVHNHAE